MAQLAVGAYASSIIFLPPPPKKKNPTLCRYVMSKVGSRIFICGGGGGVQNIIMSTKFSVFMISHAIWALFFKFWYKMGYKKTVDQSFFFFWGGGGGVPAEPSGSTTDEAGRGSNPEKGFSPPTPPHINWHYTMDAVYYFLNKTTHLSYSCSVKLSIIDMFNIAEAWFNIDNNFWSYFFRASCLHHIKDTDRM